MQLNDDFTLMGTEVLDSQVMAFDIDMFPSGRMSRCFGRRKTIHPAFPWRQGGTAWHILLPRKMDYSVQDLVCSQDAAETFDKLFMPK